MDKQVKDWEVPEYSKMIRNGNGEIFLIEAGEKKKSLFEYLKELGISISPFMKQINGLGGAMDDLSVTLDQFSRSISKSTGLMETYSKKKIHSITGYEELYKKMGKTMSKYFNEFNGKVAKMFNTKKFENNDKMMLLSRLKQLMEKVKSNELDGIDRIASDTFKNLKEYLIQLTSISVWRVDSKTSVSLGIVSKFIKQLQNPEEIPIENKSKTILSKFEKVKDKVTQVTKNIKIRSSKRTGDNDRTVNI